VTLVGPADAGNYRIKQGRYGTRWYTDPLPGCDIAPASEWTGPSISATKPPFANKYVPMKAIANMPTGEWSRLAALDPDGRYEAIKTHDKTAGLVNMRRGSLVHEWAEDLLHGRTPRAGLTYPTVVIEAATPFLPALQSFFSDYQPELVAAEVVCIHRTLNGVGYGGTADAFVRIGGDVFVVDWKSRASDHGAYMEEAAQGAAYGTADYMIVAGDDGAARREPIPALAGVLIVSIRPDGYRAYPIDLDGAAAVYTEMHRWWDAQRGFTAGKVIGRPWAPAASAPVDTERDALRHRRDRMRLNATDTGWRQEFDAQWATHGITKSSTNDEVRAALDAIEPPFDNVEPLNPQPTVDPQPQVEVDDGGPLDKATLDILLATVAASPAKPVVNRWLKEAADAGDSWNPRLRQTVRHFETTRSALALAEATDGDDDVARTILAAAITRPNVIEDAFRVGVTLGVLTIDETLRVVDIAERTLRERTDDMTPERAVAAALAA
jgi:hypothetical protein